jgi:hypothetical protein
MQMIGQKCEIQEAEKLERHIAMGLADAIAKVNPKFRDEGFLYAQGQLQQQLQTQTESKAQPRVPGVSSIPPVLRTRHFPKNFLWFIIKGAQRTATALGQSVLPQLSQS